MRAFGHVTHLQLVDSGFEIGVGDISAVDRQCYPLVVKSYKTVVVVSGIVTVVVERAESYGERLVAFMDGYMLGRRYVEGCYLTSGVYRFIGY